MDHVHTLVLKPCAWPSLLEDKMGFLLSCLWQTFSLPDTLHPVFSLSRRINARSISPAA